MGFSTGFITCIKETRVGVVFTFNFINGLLENFVFTLNINENGLKVEKISEHITDKVDSDFIKIVSLEE